MHHVLLRCPVRPVVGPADGDSQRESPLHRRFLRLLLHLCCDKRRARLRIWPHQLSPAGSVCFICNHIKNSVLLEYSKYIQICLLKFYFLTFNIQFYTVGVHLKFPLSLSASSYKFLSNEMRQKSQELYCSTFCFHMFILEAMGQSACIYVTLYQQAKGDQRIK